MNAAPNQEGTTNIDLLDSFIKGLPNNGGRTPAHDEGENTKTALIKLAETFRRFAGHTGLQDDIRLSIQFLNESIRRLNPQDPVATNVPILESIKHHIGFLNNTIGSYQESRQLEQHVHKQDARPKTYDEHKNIFRSRLSSATLLPQLRATFSLHSSTDYWTAGVKFGSLDILWDTIPKLHDVPHDSVEYHLPRTNPDGPVFDDAHVNETKIVLGAFCDAWQELTGPQFVDQRKLENLRRAANIVLVLSIMKRGRHYLDHFVKGAHECRESPYENFNELQPLLLSGNAATMFLSQQYRIHRREWTDHIECFDHEPLRLRHIETLSKIGTYAEVDLVEDIYTKERFARKIQQAAGARDLWQTEIESLNHLSEGSHDHHIVKLVKTYRRGEEFGCLLKPPATMNLHTMLTQYVGSPAEQQRLMEASLIRSFGCLSIGLWYMHEKAALRHRDIKPENLLYNIIKRGRTGIVTADEFLWTDFGFSTKFEPRGPSFTNNPSAIGTREYAAPETEKEVAHTRKTDIFSFGCVILEIMNVILEKSLRRTDSDCVIRFQPYQYNTKEVQSWIQKRTGKHSGKKRYHRDILTLAGRMTQYHDKDRPKIAEVIEDLKAIEHYSEHKLFCNTCKSRIKDGLVDQSLRDGLKLSIRQKGENLFRRERLFKGLNWSKPQPEPARDDSTQHGLGP